MSVSETVIGQTSSYRRGLVLGLTMAEVVLLIVFALLMALAAVWRAEHEKTLELEQRVTELQADRPQRHNTVDRELLIKIDRLLRSPNRMKSVRDLTLITSNKHATVLSDVEAESFADIKAQLQNMSPPEIDQHWRELVVAAGKKNLRRKLEVAEAVDRVAPGADGKKAADLIVSGQGALKDGQHDWPPIINLQEAEGYTFAKGRAELTPSFEEKLKSEIVPKLIEQTGRYKVDIIEVVGHTDEQAIALRNSNLDSVLLNALKGTTSVTSVVHADNAGLGLSRAVSVVRAFLLDGRLPQPQYRILPLSGAQLIEINERVTAGGGGDVPGRRRIEIRLRRSQESLGRKQ